MKRQYTVVVIPEEDRRSYMVMVPMLPGCFSQGRTIQEAAERVKEAICLHIRAHHKHGEEVPVEPVDLVTTRIEVEDVAESVAV